MIQLLLPVIGTLLDKLFPDPTAAAAAKVQVMEMAQRGELAALDADVRMALAQIDTNRQEAAHPSLFVSGWRPAVGWTCVIGLAYSFLLRPLLAWGSPALSSLLGAEIPVPPDLDLGHLMTLLGGMLGLGGLRTWEKSRGVARS